MRIELEDMNTGEVHVIEQSNDEDTATIFGLAQCDARFRYKGRTAYCSKPVVDPVDRVIVYRGQLYS